MSARFDRRKFLGKGTALAAAAGTGLFAAPAILAAPSPNSRLAIAGIGVGGRGKAHVRSALAENLVAVCDVAQGALDACLGQVEKHQKEHNLKRLLPETFADYREMLDKMHSRIDAVFVATPDHHHAAATMRAIKLGKHVYCEKPLSHSIDEARQLTLAARQYKVATQLGIQGRAGDDWRRLCEWVWAGAIGNVREVHVWTDRPGVSPRLLWPQGGSRPAGSDPVPPTLHWDLWLGPAPERPYLGVYKQGKFQGWPVYQPTTWRGWWDFGTGALGDQGCHALTGLFTALKIEHAAAVELLKDSGDTTSEMFPCSSVIRWDIPARGDMPPCKLFWYDGGQLPPRELLGLPPHEKLPPNAAILIGEKGNLSDGLELFSDERRKAFKAPAASIPRCASTHFGEWVTACKGGRPAAANFDHGGPLSEFVLLGNLAIRAGVGKRVEWDGPAMKCRNRPELDQFVRRPYRNGWSL